MTVTEEPTGWPVDAQTRQLLLDRIRDVPDYPEPGVLFKDITPLLADPEAFGALVEVFAARCHAHRVDKVVGLEARGFILAAPVAVRAGLGFVPVRKEGKLPGLVHGQSYDLEYGSAMLEVRQGAFASGERVMVLDDVLATGGTAGAALDLVRRAGADPVGFGVLLELGFLNGRARLEEHLGDAHLETLVDA